MKKLIIKSMAVASVALIAGCGQVDSGEVGFFTEWGQVVGKELNEGLHSYADRMEKAVKALIADRDNWRDQAFAEASRANAATCKGSLPVGNAAKMLDALKYLRDASREFHHLILNSKHNEICDKYKYAEVAKISDAIANANAALSAPARNCDRQYQNAYDVLRYFTNETGRQIFNTSDVIDWLLFAKAKGGAE